VADDGRQPTPSERRFEREVARKAARRERAKREGDRPIWYSLGLFGLVGWAVAIPTLLGLALGIWLDTRWPGRVSWTLTFLFVGIVLGCANAWHWIKQESRDDRS
jgi:ATP synthase protein I